MEGCLLYICLFCSSLFYYVYSLQGGCLLYSIILHSLKGGRVTVLFYSIVPCEERACHSSIQLYKGLQILKGGVCHCSFIVFSGRYLIPSCSITFYAILAYVIMLYSWYILFSSILLYVILLYPILFYSTEGCLL